MNLKLGFITILTLFISFYTHAQTLTGKITNSLNEPIVGASVKIVGSNAGVASDIEGRYTFSLPIGKTYELEITAVGYQPKIVGDIEAVNGVYSELNITLETKGGNLEGVVVTAKRTTARMETAASAIQFQKNTNTVASIVSAETIRRSPDRNTGEVLKRTPGASLLDGKFLVVRGLADRYNQAMLNGILLTSTEPDRKTFSFDIIPSSMIDNVIINKAFVPEMPGEWAGGLIQINTKDIPTKNFFSIQAGTGFNTQAISKDFYSAKGGKLDWLGIDDGYRDLPSNYSTKNQFTLMSPAEKTAIGKAMNNDWGATTQGVPLNASFQTNGGFSGLLFGKKIGATFGINYNRSNRTIDLLNRFNSLVDGVFTPTYNYNDKRYNQETTLGGLVSFTMQFNNQNKVSLKSIVNINTNKYTILRSGEDIAQGDEIYGGENTFKQNTFFTTQLTGEHNIINPLKLKWYGAFNILDGYSPDQRRYVYERTKGSSTPYLLQIGNTVTPESGSRLFQSLSDYIYTAGGDLAYNFDMFSKKQTVKAGYMLQVKDRLFNASLFANYLPIDNPTLRALPIDKIFAPENFGDGSSTSNLFAFGSITNTNMRYIGNTILNAGYLQFDNQFSEAFRLVWGVRGEYFDQLIGSVKKWDPRYNHTQKFDILPGLNATYKLNAKTNLRLSASQTVIRPEMRELVGLTIYDFELNASVTGNRNLQRTKVTNLDLRYELYQRAGEVFTAGVFYKYFKNPIELIMAQGGASFNFSNPQEATSYGGEIELRKRLDVVDALKNFTIQGNVAYIYSNVKDVQTNLDRPMQGQSPYLINLSLMYDLEEKGFNTTLLFNQIGRRIYAIGSVSKDPTTGKYTGNPDIYEAPRPVLDWQISKKMFNKRGELKLNISDILNRTLYFYQNSDGDAALQKGTDAYRFTRKYGSTFNLAFSYSL